MLPLPVQSIPPQPVPLIAARPSKAVEPSTDCGDPQGDDRTNSGLCQPRRETTPLHAVGRVQSRKQNDVSATVRPMKTAAFVRYTRRHSLSSAVPVVRRAISVRLAWSVSRVHLAVVASQLPATRDDRSRSTVRRQARLPRIIDTVAVSRLPPPTTSTRGELKEILVPIRTCIAFVNRQRSSWQTAQRENVLLLYLLRHRTDTRPNTAVSGDIATVTAVRGLVHIHADDPMSGSQPNCSGTMRTSAGDDARRPNDTRILRLDDVMMTSVRSVRTPSVGRGFTFLHSIIIGFAVCFLDSSRQLSRSTRIEGPVSPL